MRATVESVRTHEELVAEVRSEDRIRRDASRVVVGKTRDESGAGDRGEDREAGSAEPRRMSEVSRARRSCAIPET